MRVFIDSSVYMDYLQGSGVRIHLLKIFKELLDKKSFKLIFPNITKEEIYRGIPLDRKRFFENDKLKLAIPKVPAGVEESKKYKEAKALLDDYNNTIEEVREESLHAVDEILHDHIEKLLQNSEDIREDKAIIEEAHLRKLKNNPPGKPTDPLGDEIAWELLLQKCSNDDLTIITHDGDWKDSNNAKSSLHPFLQKEWEETSKREIVLFPSLVSFIKTVDPKKVTKEDSEVEKRRIFQSDLNANANDSIVAGSNIAIFPVTQNLGTIASPISTPSVSQWQPVTVVGTSQLVQCFSCGRWVVPGDYYGFTSSGYKCKFCI